MRKILLFLLPNFLLLPTLFSQIEWSVGASVGLANYQGDLLKEDYALLQEAQLAYALHVQAHFSPAVSVRGGLLFTQLQGNDFKYPDRKDRGYRFTTGITEVGFIGEWEPFGWQATAIRPGIWGAVSPYLSLGAGFAFTNPNPDFPNASTELNPRELQDVNAKYSKTKFIVPIGGGLKFPLADGWTIKADVAFRYPFSDYLDGISISANPDALDWYHVSTISLNYKFRSW
jgi:hypothetical protein